MNVTTVDAKNRRAIRPVWPWLVVLLTLLSALRSTAQTTVAATSVPLLYPAGLAFDAGGNLWFAETGNHAIKQISTTGALLTIAGTGTQGFSGDGGPAVAAQLDSPTAVALDAAGNIFIADTHNHRIRRIDAASAVIRTVAGTGVAGTSPDGTAAASAQLDLPVALAFDPAGNLLFADARRHLIRRIDAASGLLRTIAGDGSQGFSGDGGPATAAAIDSPYGLACDAAGNTYFADTHNHRVRRVDAVSGVVTTVAGTGAPGFAGELTPAALARLDLPRGLVADGSGNLYLVDQGNQRIRRVDAATGLIESIAGVGVQGYSGDGGPATAAELNGPRAVTLSAAGLPTLSDTGNDRIRQVNAGIIYTVGGIGGGSGSETLALTAPTVVLYGTGTAVAALTASPATGAVNLFDNIAGSLAQLATETMAQNRASFSTAALAAGVHRLEATYGGDGTHPPAQSGVVALTVAQASVVASPAPITLLYGQAIPTLTGTLAGVLAQDAGLVTLVLTTTAQALSPVGSYPIVASLAGPAAGDYAVSQTAASVTIAKAPANATLSQALSAHVASGTAGQPTGAVTLLDAGSPAGSATLSAGGDAVFSTAGLSFGTHTLAAAYAGDRNFLPVTSAPVVVSVGPVAAPDFALASAGPAAITVPSGSAATFTFAETPVNGPLPGAIVLSVAGLPRGASASFNPAQLAPSGSPLAFTLTIQTPHASLSQPDAPGFPRSLRTIWIALAAALPLGLLRRRGRRLRVVLAAGLLAALTSATGCGDRTIGYPAGATQAAAYNITVTGTATGASGNVLVRTTAVVLTTE